ncbi:MAG: hypothetical protein JWR51_3123, partial [Devosia sp.]|nr:hypothetical protein [Devosia sp.]
MMEFRDGLFTSPFGGEVDPLGSGEGAFSRLGVWGKPPHPSLRADLSPKGRGG